MEEKRTEAMTGETEQNLSIEERFARLDALIEELEGDDCTLEHSFQLYEEGMKLIAGAEAQVDQVEKQLRILNGDETDDGQTGETRE